jgi:hypothetical protein
MQLLIFKKQGSIIALYDSYEANIPFFDNSPLILLETNGKFALRSP